VFLFDGMYNISGPNYSENSQDIIFLS
jgi:hypothetical protein